MVRARRTTKGWEGIHAAGKWFAVDDARLWLILNSEAEEAWTFSQDSCQNGPGGSYGWQHWTYSASRAQKSHSASGKDLLRFAVLMPPTHAP